MTEDSSRTEGKPRAAPPRATVPLRAVADVAKSSLPPRLSQYVVTQPGTCPYLPDTVEQKLVTALDPATPEAYGTLHAAGFRRSHDMAYRPVCPTCDKCKSLRIDVNAFRPNRTQRKLHRRHADLTRIVSDRGPSEEAYRLFHHYTKARHHDGEMASMGVSDFASLVLESSVDTHLIEWHLPNGRPGETLVAACLCDVLGDGISMVYSFFDCDDPADSYGTFMILSLMEVCRRLELPYLFLGYWVQGSSSMDYKAKFRAAETFEPGGWTAISNINGLETSHSTPIV